jgi:hypothetical protein
MANAGRSLDRFKIDCAASLGDGPAIALLLAFDSDVFMSSARSPA